MFISIGIRPLEDIQFSSSPFQSCCPLIFPKMWLLAKFVLKGNNGNTFLESFILNFQNLPPI